MWIRIGTLVVLLIVFAASYRPIERAQPEQVGGMAITITCYPDDFMAAENTAMINAAVRAQQASGPDPAALLEMTETVPRVQFTRGECPLAAAIEIDAQRGGLSFDGGGAYFVAAWPSDIPSPFIQVRYE